MAVIELAGEELKENKGREWLLTNGQGGYSCLDVLGKSGKDYQGILVSSPQGEDFTREILVKNLDEGVSGNLKKFEWDPHLVRFRFSSEEIGVGKRVKSLQGHEGIEVMYELENNLNSELEFKVNLLLDSGREVKLWNEHTLGFLVGASYVLVFSDHARCFENRPVEWRESVFIPARFLLTLREREERKVRIIVISAATEEKALRKYKKIELKEEEKRQEKVLSSGPGTSIFSLLSVAQGFIVERKPKLGVIGGYPFGGESGREAMLSLPGLTLIGSNFKATELILERFLNKATSKGIPGKFVGEEPLYEDNLEATLWLVDRLYQYRQYIGEEKFKLFLHTYWWNLKDIFRNYCEREKNGLLKDVGRTWMEGVKREYAVEIQGLWYNALKIMEKFAGLMEDSNESYLSAAEAHQENFLEKFQEGDYLKDSLKNDVFTPNQVILLSLDFNLVSGELAKKIVERTEEELLTPYGLKTLAKGSAGYNVGDKFKGAVWPWLLGPFVKARNKVFPEGKKESYHFIRILFEEEVRKNCLGSIGEFYHAESYAALGNISHVSSVAELLRAYFEDIQGRKGVQQQNIFF